MKKSKRGTQTTPNPKNAKSKESITKANIAASAKTLSKSTPGPKDLKYVYPEDCTTPNEKKEFRRKARAARNKFDKAIKELSKSNEQADRKELKKISREFEEFQAGIYTHP
jgi:hypothetical protein